MDKVTVITHKFKIQERRKQVASLVARAKTESEIALQLNVNQSTISRDVKILRQLSQQFIYDLAKSDLAYYYKQCIDGIAEANKEAWRIYQDDEVPLKEKLAALKIIIQANESKFKLLTEGPSILAMKSLEERLNTLESSSPLSTK
jgi:IS30 family transposase